jgi:hypothetical protein
LAIRFAAWEESKGESRAIVLPELGGAVGEPIASAALEILSDRLPAGTIALIVAPPSVAENLPERLVRAFDLFLDPRGRWMVHKIPVGVAGLSLSTELTGEGGQ